jgi:hypothetical protein
MSQFALDRSRSRERKTDNFDAYVIISTHGKYEGKKYKDMKVTHDSNINVTKINATRFGVCNYLDKDDSETMGRTVVSRLKVNDPFIGLLQNYIKTNTIAKPNSRDEEFRDMIRNLDPDYKLASKLKLERAPWSDLPKAKDEDFYKYQQKAANAYGISKIYKGKDYVNKTYVITVGEKLNDPSNFFNTIMVINKNGEIVGDILEMLYQTEMYDEFQDPDGNPEKQYTITLDKILKILKDSPDIFSEDDFLSNNAAFMEYKNVLIIDLACSPTDLNPAEERRLARSIDKGDIAGKSKSDKSKKKKKKKLKRKSKRKTKRKLKKNKRN